MHAAATVVRVVTVALAVAAPACHLVEPEGRQQTTTFTNGLTPQETRARAEGWLAERGLYQVTRSEPGFVRGEKRRPRSIGPGDQIDVLSVTMNSVPEGTRVEVQALTFLVTASGGRERADQVSPEALADQSALIQFLMPRPS
jgi:hypothetical protein